MSLSSSSLTFTKAGEGTQEYWVLDSDLSLTNTFYPVSTSAKYDSSNITRIIFYQGNSNPFTTISKPVLTTTVQITSNFITINSNSNFFNLNQLAVISYIQNINDENSFYVEEQYSGFNGLLTKNNLINPTIWTVTDSNTSNSYTAELTQDSPYIFETTFTNDETLLNIIAPLIIAGSDILHTFNNSNSPDVTIPSMGGSWIYNSYIIALNTFNF
jgi:hypothetical protein